jgi:hypothetical protein
MFNLYLVIKHIKIKYIIIKKQIVKLNNQNCVTSKRRTSDVLALCQYRNNIF